MIYTYFLIFVCGLIAGILLMYLFIATVFMRPFLIKVEKEGYIKIIKPFKK